MLIKIENKWAATELPTGKLSSLSRHRIKYGAID